jgi:hypothetical protein
MERPVEAQAALALLEPADRRQPGFETGQAQPGIAVDGEEITEIDTGIDDLR